MKYVGLILILLAGSLSAEDSANGKTFLCIPDKATSFLFNDKTKSWDQTKFNVADSKYLVRPNTDDTTPFKYELTEIGEEFPIASCEEGFNQYGWLQCGAGVVVFTMNAYSLRFTHFFRGGYINSTLELGLHHEDLERDEGRWDVANIHAKRVEDEGSDTPFIEIGNCSAL